MRWLGLAIALTFLARSALAACTIAPVEFDERQTFNCDAGASKLCNGTGGAGLTGATHAQNLDATVTGSCVGTPTAQIVDAVSTSTVLAGPFTASNTSGSNWRATAAPIPVRLGYHKMQWYDSGSPSTKYTATNKQAAGTRWLYSGQSNGVFMYTAVAGSLTPDANTAIFDGTNWLNTGAGGGGTSTPVGNGAVEFCNQIVTATGVNCAFVVAADSGAPISTWELINTTATYTSGDVHITVASSAGMDSGAGGGRQFTYGTDFSGQTITSISGNVLTLDVAPTGNGTNVAIQVIGLAWRDKILTTHLNGGAANWGTDFAGVVWIQGETDAIGGTLGADWLSMFANVIGPFTTLSGRSKILFGISTIGDYSIGSDLTWPPIRNANHSIVATDAALGTYSLGDTADLLLDGTGLHHDLSGQPGYKAMGARWALATLNAMGVSGYGSGDGPTISALYKQATNLLCYAVTQNNGTLLQDTNGDTTGTLISPDPFLAFDNGTPITLTSPSFVGNKICFTGTYNAAHTITGSYLEAANNNINSWVTTYDDAPPLGVTETNLPGLPLRPSFGVLTAVDPPASSVAGGGGLFRRW